MRNVMYLIETALLPGCFIYYFGAIQLFFSSYPYIFLGGQVKIALSNENGWGFKKNILKSSSFEIHPKR